MAGDEPGWSLRPGETMLPSLETLQQQILSYAGGDTDAKRRITLQLEQLPYAVSTMWYAITALAREQRVTVASADPADGRGYSIRSLNQDDRNRMALFIDLFLDSGTRAQNALVPYLRMAEQGKHIQLSKSFKGVMKQIVAGASLLPVIVQELLSVYHSKSGARLRAYRDLGQHYAVPSSDARTYTNPQGIVQVYLVLPNNPEAISSGTLSYENPTVNALPYVRDSMYSFLRTAHAITRWYAAQGPRLARWSHGTNLRAPKYLDPAKPMEGNPVPSDEDLDRELADIVASLPLTASLDSR